MITIRCVLCLSALLFLSVPVGAQQVADTLFQPPLTNPAYVKGGGPIILLDEAHTNFHTRHGRFKPFADFIERDGYRVIPLTKTFSDQSLDGAKILVIANALHPDNAEKWSLPTPSAFSPEEIMAVNTWVKEGGSLFLIADHMPFPGAASALAASFGFEFINGFAMRVKGKSKDIFTIGKGLNESVITLGKNSNPVMSIQTFTGQAFRIPKDATSIITLDDRYEVLIPEVAWQFSKTTPKQSAAGLSQGAYMKFGKGRVVIFGEAAMFSAQKQGKSKFGMNQETASQNPQLLLNIIHWLDGIIE